MTPDPIHQPSRRVTLGIGLFSFVLLFLGFSGNLWRVAEVEWFQAFQRDSEGHVLGRMVKSRRDGHFSAAGLMGVVSLQPAGESGPPPPLVLQKDQARFPRGDLVEFQYEAYLENLTFHTYSAYLSQNGGQGMAFGVFSALSPFSPEVTLGGFHLLTAALSALALTLVIVWFGGEFGGLAAGVLTVTTVLSQWLVVFGRNLWWNLWAFYLPMAALLYLLRKNGGREVRGLILGSVVFLMLLIKCLANGYEYITTTLVMMLVPLVYFGVLEGWSGRRFFKACFAAAVGATLAVGLSATVLLVQLAAVKGSLAGGLSHLAFSLGARTHGAVEAFPASYGPNLEAGSLQVLLIYLKGVFFDLNNYVETGSPFVARFLFSVRFLYLIALFGLVSIPVWMGRSQRTPEADGRRGMALVCATWFSILAPLSWYIIFKAHSHAHPHMNHVVWHMPFTLFGFALCGVAMEKIARKVVPPYRIDSG